MPNVPADLKAVFTSLGTYKEFRCDYCADKGNFVSGPHSHVCGRCGNKAFYGWYTEPLCQECKK